MRGDEFIPMACPICKCELYTVTSIKQYEGGNFIQAVRCANNTCKHTIGFLEPNVVTSKLTAIDTVLQQVSTLLAKIEPHFKIKPTNIPKADADALAVDAHQNQYPQIPKGAKFNPGEPQLDQTSTGMQKKDNKPPQGATPAEDPASSDPEADQSLE